MKLLGSLLIAWSVMFSAAQSEDRQALVIGNGDYVSPRKLKNPAQDAEAMAKNLRAAGFDVTKKVDLGYEEMEAVLTEFSRRLDKQSTALVFFAGHGVQVDGVNYLIPVDATVDAAEKLKFQAVALEMVLALLDRRGEGAKLKIVILDCCRNNPFGRNWLGSRSAVEHRGLAVPRETPGGTFLCFAADPGKVASDGPGNNSPYTEGLLEHFFTPGLDIDLALKKVGAKVQKDTNGKQNPWRNSNFNGVFSIVGNPPPPGSAKPAPQEPNEDPGPPPLLTLPDYEKQLLDKERAGFGHFVDLGSGHRIILRCVPGGEFVMGSPEEEKGRQADEEQVQVELSSHFWMAETELTQAQWQAVMENNPSQFKGAELPVDSVSWKEARRFIDRLNSKQLLPEGWRWALPTEAQWERACRGGKQTAFGFGEESAQLFQYGNYADWTFSKGKLGKADQDDGIGATSAPGKRYLPNAYGLYNMHGNVWEWCQDWYKENLKGGHDPQGPTQGEGRVVKGGSWGNSATTCRSARRDRVSPEYFNDNLGFRPVVVRIALN